MVMKPENKTGKNWSYHPWVLSKMQPKLMLMIGDVGDVGVVGDVCDFSAIL